MEKLKSYFQTPKIVSEAKQIGQVLKKFEKLRVLKISPQIKLFLLSLAKRCLRNFEPTFFFLAKCLYNESCNVLKEKQFRIYYQKRDIV